MSAADVLDGRQPQPPGCVRLLLLAAALLVYIADRLLG